MARILIVDDSQVMRNILRTMLETAGHEIAGNAENGVEALKMYEELKPELVTMDIRMAGGDGLTYLEKIMQEDPNARVIMVSALGNDVMVEQARSIGAVGYVTKPFQKEALLKKIQNVLAK